MANTEKFRKWATGIIEEFTINGDRIKDSHVKDICGALNTECRQLRNQTIKVQAA